MGLYSHNHGIWSNEAPHGGDPAFYDAHYEEQTFAVHLQRAGYRTAIHGKWLNYHQRLGDPQPDSGEGKNKVYASYIAPGWDEFGDITTPPYPGADTTDYFRDQAKAFIKSTPQNQPFFEFLSVIPPHNPNRPAERHRNAPVPEFVPRGSYDEADTRDKASDVRGFARLSAVDRDEIESVRTERLRSLMAVDEMIPPLIDVLRETGRLDDTYIIFVSDNGWMYGEHRYTHSKAAPYEEAIRTPFIVRGPGVAQGRSLEHLVSLVDLFPTFMELGGIASPDYLDGKSIVPLLRATPPPESSWRKSLLIEDDGFKVVRYRSGNIDAAYFDWGAGELYDMRLDPYQIENLIYWGGDGTPAALWPDTPTVNRVRDTNVLANFGSIMQEFDRLKACVGVECR